MSPDSATQPRPRHSLRAPDGLSREPLLLDVWDAMGRPRCHLVGGFVRDHLLGRSSNDLDFAVPGPADKVAVNARRLADALGVRPHLLGQPPRSIWRVEAQTVKVELWPMDDLTLEADVRRRDFTCNALAWRVPEGPLVDRVRGRSDLAAGRLRAVARGNLADDPLRCLRASRLLAQLEGFRIEADTARWIRELAPRLGSSPRERVGQELRTLVAGHWAASGLEALVGLGLLGPSAPPGCDTDPAWLKRNAAAASVIATGRGHPAGAALRAAGDATGLVPILRAWGAPDDTAVASYGWPRELRRTASRAAALLDDTVASVDLSYSRRRMLIHLAGEAFPALLASAAAVATAAGAPLSGWTRWWRMWRRSRGELVDPRPVLSAIEVAEIAGVEPGPRLGSLLDALVTAQVRGEVRTAGGGRRWLRRHLRLEADRLPFPGG
jgi:tRNA nucleotidyltransferase (CCA-adding enzyme)